MTLKPRGLGIVQLGDDLMPSNNLIGGYDFDALRSDPTARYTVLDLDLSTARTNIKIETYGTFLGVFALTTGASFTLRFNGIANPAITFDSEQQIMNPFYTLHLTNSAQAGATVKLYIGINSFYIPYYRVRAVAPTVSTMATGQVALNAVTSTAIVASSSSNRQVVIHNPDTTNIVYIGNATVTASGATIGLPIYPGTERIFLEPFFTGAIYGITSAGTINVIKGVFTE